MSPEPTPEQPAPLRKLPPAFCSNCSSPDMHWHCDNPQCTWADCRNCRKITDLTGMTA